MKQAVLIRVEDTLANCLEREIPAAPPIDAGLKVWASQKPRAEVFFCSTAQPYRVQHWLVQHLELLEPPKVLEDSVMENIATVRSLGYGVEFYIDGSPTRCAEAMRAGVSTMLLCHPAYMRPEHRPGAIGRVRGWDEIVDEIAQQREQRANDERANVDAALGRFEPQTS